MSSTPPEAKKAGTGKSGPYGTFRPATAPPSRTKPEPPSIDDPRHADDSPMPWLRYFFPKDFDMREGKPVEPYYQFFDVVLQSLQEDTAIPPPDWAPNAYFQLSFTQLHVPPDLVLATRIPKPPPPPGGSIDLTRDNSKLLQPGNEKLMAEILAFCRSVATFRARTWKDALPLVDLLRGVLMHLVNHYMLGAALLKEQATKDAEASLSSEKVALKAWYNKQLEEGLAKARAEYEEKLEAQKEELRMTLAEDLTLQLRAEREEKNQLRQQVQQLEAQMRKTQEATATLQRQIEHGQQQIELEARRRQEALAGRDAQLAALQDQHVTMRRRLAATQAAVVEALSAKTKEDALNVAVKVLANSLPSGTAAYVAELRTAADVDNDDPAATLIAETTAAAATVAGEGEGEAGGVAAPLRPALAAMRGVTQGFMASPLAAVVGGAAAAAGMKAPGGGGGSARASRPNSAVLTSAMSELKETLVFKYIKASPGHDFMLGQKLAYGTGVSWRVVERGVEMHVTDVSEQPGMWFFRQLDRPRGGSYFAAPIIGISGEVVGMLCVDTMAAAAAEAAAAAAAAGATAGTPAAAAAASSAISATVVSDMAFVRGLANAVGARARADAEAYADALAALALEGAEEVAEPPPAPLDPQLFVSGDEGISGGLRLFSQALSMLRRLTDEELQELRNLDSPDDVTLAVIKSILAAVGEVGADDWAHARAHINRELLDRLVGLDPQQAWAEWQALCRVFMPLNDISASSLDAVSTGVDEAEAVQPSSKVSMALARWAASVRIVSAAKAMQVMLEAKLKVANAALMKTFSGDSSHALNELRSYRVPPPLTFGVLQCVLMLCGTDEEDCRNWARMRTLCTQRLIKGLVTLRPAQVPRRVFKAVKRLVGDLVEAEVKQESVATLSLYRWLCEFTRLAAVA